MPISVKRKAKKMKMFNDNLNSGNMLCSMINSLAITLELTLCYPTRSNHITCKDYLRLMCKLKSSSLPLLYEYISFVSDRINGGDLLFDP